MKRIEFVAKSVVLSNPPKNEKISPSNNCRISLVSVIWFVEHVMMAVRYHGCTCHMRYGVAGGRGGGHGGHGTGNDSNGNAKDMYDHSAAQWVTFEFWQKLRLVSSSS